VNDLSGTDSGRNSEGQRVGIVGLGYVGLPLALGFALEGHEVVGLDIDARRIEQIRAGHSYIEDVDASQLARAVSDGLLTATTNYDDLVGAEAIVICVPTPLTANRQPDLGPVVDTATSLSRVLRRDQLVVLESTTYPGTTRERLVPLLEESGLAAGRDFHVAYSPERVDPGRSDFTLRNTVKILGGLTPACSDRAKQLYERVCDDVMVLSTPDAAEMAKLLENIFRSVNIALVNELAVLCDRMGIDVWEVIDAAATKPFGFMRFDPGPGMGGHCLPVDPFYLAWRAREFDFYTEFIELAGKLNQSMPYFCVDKIERTLNDQGKAVHGSKILLLGVAYKPGVGDLRESPALKILKLLGERGADLSYHDPHVTSLPEARLESVPFEQELEAADLVVIVTAHPELDYRRVASEARLVLDFRGVTRGIESSNLVRL
jgi:UDP-N-acetyl-D-glucosamine dehydrogenase